MTRIELPFPLPVSACFENVPKIGRRATARYREWTNEALWMIKSQKPQKFVGEVSISIGLVAPDKRARDKVMSAVFEAQETFRGAWPLRRYGKLDNVFYHAVRFIAPRVQKEFTIRRARSIYEGTARRIDSEEMDALRAAVYEETRREQQELRTRLAELDKILAGGDAPEDGKTLAETRPFFRGSGRMDR